MFFNRRYLLGCLAVLPLTACTSEDKSAPASISNTPSASTDQTPSTQVTTAATESASAEPSASQSALLKDKAQAIVSLVTSLANAQLGEPDKGHLLSQAEGLNIELAEGLVDYYSQSSESMIYALKQASGVQGEEVSESQLRFTVDVYKARSAIHAGESVSAAASRLASEMTSLAGSAPETMKKSTFVFVLDIAEDGTSGVMSLEGK